MLKIRKKLAEKKEASKGIAKAGFTLIELLVVIAILAILVLLAAPKFLGYTKDANVRAMQADAKVLANSALIYNVENNGSWPVADSAPVIKTITQGGKDIKVVAIEEAKLSNRVQTLKGNFADYGIVTEKGSNQGSVFHLSGVEDKDRNIHYGVDLVDTAADATDDVTLKP